ncbi:skin secretory protein xP2-like [Iris pallida]|uniref:Skin secretory protein xP2-like n=1 Tax=Iris pallida TaxID=29817 RepID=A0AAX6I6Y6_IRIPA|nr:skin secretory protein xP2-like [Iris pallida]
MQTQTQRNFVSNIRTQSNLTTNLKIKTLT